MRLKNFEWKGEESFSRRMVLAEKMELSVVGRLAEGYKCERLEVAEQTNGIQPAFSRISVFPWS